MLLMPPESFIKTADCVGADPLATRVSYFHVTIRAPRPCEKYFKKRGKQTSRCLNLEVMKLEDYLCLLNSWATTCLWYFFRQFKNFQFQTSVSVDFPLWQLPALCFSFHNLSIYSQSRFSLIDYTENILQC